MDEQDAEHEDTTMTTRKNMQDMTRAEYEATWDRMVRDANARSERDRRENPEKYERTFHGCPRRPLEY
jgi:hypothetical protein